MDAYKFLRKLGLVLVVVLAGGGLLLAQTGQALAEAGQGPRPQRGPSWQIETVESGGSIGRAISLALDSAGRPHIAYARDSLYYAWFDGGRWQSESVDSTPGVGEFASLALDVHGRAHIAYFDGVGGDLRYAYQDGVSWGIETVDSTGWVGTGASLALDSTGLPRISYYDSSNELLKLAWHDGTAWNVATVGPARGQTTSLALGAENRPHIAYAGDGVKHAYFDGTSWWTETVVTANVTGGHISMALDAAEHPHISYSTMHAWGYSLGYAHYNGAYWQIEAVDGGITGAYTTIALDITGRPHIAYHATGHGVPRYARHTGTSWRIEAVGSSGGFHTTLALDAAGCPHIAYFHWSNYDLKYARFPVRAFADPAFESVWQRTDKPIAEGRATRSWMWGPGPFSGSLYEPYVESPGGTRLVQYSDKSRMEINNPGGDRSSPWFVTNGLLVREMVEGRVQVGDYAFDTRRPAGEAVAGDPAPVNSDCPTYASFTGLIWGPVPSRVGQPVSATLAKDGTVGEDPGKVGYPRTEIAYYESATGHNVPRALWDFMNQRGLIYVDGRYRTGVVVDWVFAMGYPISEPYWVRCRVAGQHRDVLVQLFERRVLTYTPENPVAWQVEMGNVGLHYFGWRYGTTPP